MDPKTGKNKKAVSSIHWASGLAAATTGGIAASQSQAGIIYTPFNATVNAANPTANIDFDGDGIADVQIDYSPLNGLTLNKQGTKLSYLAGADGMSVAALPFGETVGLTPPTSDVYDEFIAPGASAILNNGAAAGYFTSPTPATYIGLAMGLSSESTGIEGETSETNYAWIGFNVTNNSSLANLTAQITGIAYESGAAVPITTGAVPEPSSLALLALGAVGLTAYRRRSGFGQI